MYRRNLAALQWWLAAFRHFDMSCSAFDKPFARLGATPVLAITALLALGLPVRAYIRSTTSGGVPLRRTDAANVVFLQNEKIGPGIRNRAGNLILTADSDPGAGLRAALNAWNSVTVSAARFAPLGTTSAMNDPHDGQNVFVLADNDEVRSILGGALAVTVVQFLTDGRILDTDMLFNPDIANGTRHYQFSTTLASGTYDLQSVATHELGHALGADHSGIVGAVMFPVTLSASAVQSRPRIDDISFLAEVYPAAGAADFGTLTGMVQYPDGSPVRGALVAALDPATGAAVGSLSSFTDGSYRIGRIPPGHYVVLAEAADNPFLPTDLGNPDSRIQTEFGTTVLGGFDSPQLVEVAPSATANASLTAPASKSLNALAIGVGSVGGSGDGRGGYSSIAVRAGQPADILLWAQGVNAARVSVKVLGPGITLRAGSVRSDPQFVFAGVAALRFTVDAGPGAGLATVLLSQDGAVAAYTAGLVLPGTPPQFTAAGVANAAGFGADGVAPGEIVSIYGSNLGPPSGLQNGGLEPSTGALPTDVGNLSVLFNNQFAPIFYASDGQVNLQAPYEIAGRTSVNIVARMLDAVSDPVSVPVVAAAPGIFRVAGSSQGIIFNQNYTLNGPANPAARESVVMIYGTGQGVADPPAGTGVPVQFPPYTYAQNPTATVGSIAAEVTFGGLAPGFAGLYQVNVRIPKDASPGSAVPIRIGAAGKVSPAGTTIAIQ